MEFAQCRIHTLYAGSAARVENKLAQKSEVTAYGIRGPKTFLQHDKCMWREGGFVRAGSGNQETVHETPGEMLD
jgi:hypothetical protein